MAIKTLCTEIESNLFLCLLHETDVAPVGNMSASPKFVHVYGNKMLPAVSQGHASGQQVVRYNSE
jgi:hypothetical protein